MRKRKPLALAGIGLTAITMFLLTPVFLLALAGCGLPEGRPVMRLEPCERCRQGAGKMSYNVVTTEGVRTFENIDDAGDYAQSMSLRTGEPAKVFHAETGLVAFTVRPTTKDTK